MSDASDSLFKLLDILLPVTLLDAEEAADDADKENAEDTAAPSRLSDALKVQFQILHFNAAGSNFLTANVHRDLERSARSED